MLIADVSQLLGHLGETQLVEMPYEIELSGDDFKVVSPVVLKLTLLSTGKSILVQGAIAGEIEATCSRCLNIFHQKFNVSVEEEYKKLDEIMTATAKDRELGEEDFVYTIDSEGRIDLSEVVRQNILVNLPLKFICKQSCKGLAKRKKSGGANRRGAGDPRLAKLKELKKGSK